MTTKSFQASNCVIDFNDPNYLPCWFRFIKPRTLTYDILAKNLFHDNPDAFVHRFCRVMPKALFITYPFLVSEVNYPLPPLNALHLACMRSYTTMGLYIYLRVGAVSTPRRVLGTHFVGKKSVIVTGTQK